MAQVWMVSKVLGLANGMCVSIPVRAYSSKETAERFIRDCQAELSQLASAQLIAETPQGMRQVGRGTMIAQAFGIQSIQLVAAEAEVHGAVEVAPPGKLLI